VGASEGSGVSDARDVGVKVEIGSGLSVGGEIFVGLEAGVINIDRMVKSSGGVQDTGRKANNNDKLINTILFIYPS
jgi:hypothetical protein